MTSPVEDALEAHLKTLAIPPFVREHEFHPTRSWSFDFAWPELFVALEVEGGNYGRHQRREGFDRDCEKYNAAAVLGWSVLRFSSGMIKRKEHEQILPAFLKNRLELIEKCQ